VGLPFLVFFASFNHIKIWGFALHHERGIRWRERVFFLSLVRVPRSELRLSKVRDAFFPPFALFLFLNFKDKGITQQAVRKTEKFFFSLHLEYTTRSTNFRGRGTVSVRVTLSQFQEFLAIFFLW
jgi:hypothetical protein